MRIKKNTNMLCLRFSDVGGMDCIKEHEDVIRVKKFVWFGKIGIKPAKSRVESLLSGGLGFLILKKPNGIYLCEFDSYSYEQPEINEYPSYYDNKVLLGERDFSIWFRIKSIVELSKKETLDNIVVKSSREPFLITANKSMSSVFYVTNRMDLDVELPTN